MEILALPPTAKFKGVVFGGGETIGKWKFWLCHQQRNSKDHGQGQGEGPGQGLDYSFLLI